MPSPEQALVGGLLSGSALTLLAVWLVSPLKERPRLHTKRARQCFERRNLDALQGRAAHDVVGRGDGEARERAKLVRVLQPLAPHQSGKLFRVPLDHAVEASLKLPLAQEYRLAYIPSSLRRSAL